MDKCLLLIDGHSIASRAFYGIPDLTNSQGVHTNAVYGFINIFLNAFESLDPSWVIVAFDVKEKTFRHKMYPEYKGTRKPMPEELHEQIPVLKEALKAMGIRTVELPGYEADDILGTYAKSAERDGVKAYVLSGDRDLLQLASETTMVMIPKTKSFGNELEKYYAEDVKEKYGVTPAEFIDMKALMGDSSDNIPGIPGIGEKTASKIISQFGSLENAYAHIDEITPPRAQKNLSEYIEQGRLSRTLSAIDTDVPVPVKYMEASVSGKQDLFNPASYEIFKKLELKRLLERFDQEDIKSSEEIDYEALPAEFFKAEDIKEDRIGFFADKSLTLFAVSSGDKNLIFQGNGKDSSYRDEILKLFSSGKEICCFGLKKILHALKTEDFESDRIFDLEVMAYLLNPLQNSYTYDVVLKDYMGKIIPSVSDLIGKESLSEAVSEPQKRGAAFEVCAYSSSTAFQAFPVLKEELEKNGMWDLYMNIEMPLIYSLYNMEKEGILVNREALKEFSGQLSDDISRYEDRIYSQAGEEFNINSPKQLGNILFEKLKLPHGKKTKSGYSTSASVLEKLAPDYPIVDDILNYRQLTKLKSTYADGLVNFISEDGRIHGTFNQTVTATGRISSTDPNLQNIPIRKQLGQEIRKAFVAKEGCVFIDADYSQIELRLMAHMSGDPNLIEAYNSEADIHKITASKVFHTPLNEVTPQQRSNAKAVNFGIIYGISSFGLSQGLSITRKEAQEYISQYFDTYPKVKEYLDNTVKEAKENGYVTTMFGRRRPVPELKSSSYTQRTFGERVAMNSPLQGSAADIIKIAMINVDKELKRRGLKSRIVLQVHDELLVETYIEETDEVKEILEDKMRHAADLKVPLETGIGQGKDWFEAH